MNYQFFLGISKLFNISKKSINYGIFSIFTKLSKLNCDNTTWADLNISHYREELGPDCVIVVLTMDSKERRERVLARHQGDTNTADVMDVILGLACFQISIYCVAAF